MRTWFLAASMVSIPATVEARGRRVVCRPCPSPPVVCVTPAPLDAFDRLPPEVKACLSGMEAAAKDWSSLYVEFERSMTNKVTHKSSRYTVSLRALKPNHAYLRFDNAARKDDFEAMIFNPRSAFIYRGFDQTVSEYRRPDTMPDFKPRWPDILSPFFLSRHPIVEFASGSMSARTLANRFAVERVGESEHYTYLTLKSDKSGDGHYGTITLAVYKPGIEGYALHIAAVRFKYDDSVDQWTVRHLMVNPEGIRPEQFQYIEPPRSWKQSLLKTTP